MPNYSREGETVLTTEGRVAFGKALTHMRKVSGLPLIEIGKKLELGNATVHRMERGVGYQPTSRARDTVKVFFPDVDDPNVCLVIQAILGDKLYAEIFENG